MSLGPFCILQLSPVSSILSWLWKEELSLVVMTEHSSASFDLQSTSIICQVIETDIDKDRQRDRETSRMKDRQTY